ncbi:hypothetical protein M153_1100068910 [Pseudoloma neurophilia]|uniref:Uncharacterized protein n=1 Tax=Pseudoloma neurophilia TaxID=146866 RepID=A0A0R0M588_9MICR|nr:hypothetical protein M153_1100068910 [Pseudoloma neurophilia]
MLNICLKKLYDKIFRKFFICDKIYRCDALINVVQTVKSLDVQII